MPLPANLKMYLAPYIAQKPVDDFSLPFSQVKYGVKLPGNPLSAVPLTIPGDAARYKAVIRVFAGARVFVASVPKSPTGLTAEFPGTAAFTTEISEIVPDAGLCREVKAGDILSFVSDVPNTFVSVVLYSINAND
jgi:hypothetical protein